MQLIENYTGQGETGGLTTVCLETGPELKPCELDVVKQTQHAANRSMSELKTLSHGTGKEMQAAPLKVGEALMLLLEKVKGDFKVQSAVIQELSSQKEDTPKGEEYRLLLLQLLSCSQEESRRKIEEIADIEKDWVLVENDGSDPSEIPCGYAAPTWGSTLWKAAIAGGSAAWTIGIVSGKIGYRLYVESTRIGTIVLLGIMVVQNPLFPILQMLVKILIK